MLRKIFSIFIIVMLINTSFYRYYVYLGFEFNRKYIIENICENRARPDLKCNGNCYLIKKLKQADDNNKKQNQENILKNLELVFFKKIQPFFFSATEKNTDIAHIFGFHGRFHKSMFIAKIFEPPRPFFLFT